STRLLGITDPRVIRRDFPFVFPVALGTPPVAPIQMLRAFTAFANRGIPEQPNPIRYVEDRNGQIIRSYEQESLRNIQDTSHRILSEQTAYVMTKMLESVPNGGTLSSSRRLYEEEYGAFEFPLAAKTGTAENWSDGWVIGYTPYYTTAVWVGFDQAGNSLGEKLYGGKVAGPMFMRIMDALHQNENPDAGFVKPEGIYNIAVDKRNGYLWVEACGEENKTNEWFLKGTGPTKDCTQAPQTDVFNFGIISSYSQPEAVVEDSEAIDISSFDFLNDAPISDEAGSGADSSLAPKPLDSLDSLDSLDDLSNLEDGLQENFGENTAPATEEAKLGAGSDQFIEHRQGAISELDSLIQSEN
ncbi:MAG: penicillin-binding transpeptidase domain-containing protein, partial [Spirochaetota bacterium]